MLETPTEEREADLDYLPPVNPGLGLERDWRDAVGDEESEEEEEEKPTPAWRHEETETDADANAGPSSKDGRAGGFEAIQARKTAGDAWEPAEEKPEPDEMSAGTQEAPADSPDGTA